jgi:hypothetical protein
VVTRIFFAACTAWGACWLAVMLEYGRAAYASWRTADGRWRDVPGQALGFGRWFALNLWQDLRHRFRPYVEQMPQPYSAGHMLRFFISISALVAGVMGAASAVADRSLWPAWIVATLLFALAASTAAALGHLSLAWIDRPRRWRLFVLAVAAWLPLAMWLR